MQELFEKKSPTKTIVDQDSINSHEELIPIITEIALPEADFVS